MSFYNPKHDRLLLDLTLFLVICAAAYFVVAIVGCPLDVFGQEPMWIDRQIAEQRRQLGETQYTCPPGRTQYVPGPAGPAGMQGPPGPPGEVDYKQVEALVTADVDRLAAGLNQALNNWRADANKIDADLATRINNNAKVIGQWSSEIESMNGRLAKLETSTAPGGVAGPTPTSAPPAFSLGDSWLSTAAIGLLGAAGVAVPWWAVLLIRGAWRAYRTTHQPPAVGRPPVQPFRTTDATNATASDTRVAGDSDEPPDGYYEDGE